MPGYLLLELCRATETEGLKKVAVVGGGVGCAIAYPVAKKLHALGVEVHSIVGFRTKDLVILEDEFKDASSKFVLMSDDGSVGEKGLVTDALKKLIDSGEKYLPKPEPYQTGKRPVPSLLGQRIRETP